LFGEKNGKRFGMKFFFVVKNVDVIKKGKQLKNKQDLININAIIEMAWCDKTSFDSIKEQTGLLEKEVIKIMRSNLKISSFKVWRERVYGRKAKHAKI
jgi:uncharacterized protein (TIGR03643 family)|tara:strand:+ start:214 stop:507 length:294 start_codon:yes stop_codon:yes gene_type:complete